MFEAPDMVSKTTLEMSSILILWGLIMIFHIEAALLTTIPVDLNRISNVKLE